jgi:cytochrome c oxidase cbb3-type subunit 2
MLLAVALSACTPEGWGPDALSRGSGDIDDETLALGQESYEMYCSGCHGVNGDGAGPAAKYLDPKPRDFRVGMLKFASVAAGKTPYPEDYIHTITNGLAGTAMPSFKFIPVREQQAIVAYLQTFRTEETSGPGEKVLIPKDPYRKKPQYAAPRGEALYHALAECSSCHPAYATRAKILEFRKNYKITGDTFRDDMYESVTKESEWGAPITPPDFLFDRIKTGSKKEQIVKVIATGVGGTAMPNWAATLKDKQLWALAYYVESLAAMRGTPEGRQLMTTLEQQEAKQQ